MPETQSASTHGQRKPNRPGWHPVVLIDYLDLIDWAGRILRSDKRGAIPAKARTILESLSINDEAWLESVSQFEYRFGYALSLVANFLPYT